MEFTKMTFSDELQITKIFLAQAIQLTADNIAVCDNLISDHLLVKQEIQLLQHLPQAVIKTQPYKHS